MVVNAPNTPTKRNDLASLGIADQPKNRKAISEHPTKFTISVAHGIPPEGDINKATAYLRSAPTAPPVATQRTNKRDVSAMIHPAIT
jgi:hypothetical protein